jgi:hypothetical protein
LPSEISKFRVDCFEELAKKSNILVHELSTIKIIYFTFTYEYLMVLVSNLRFEKFYLYYDL